MGKPILIFRGSNGINTKLDPTRLRFDAENGIVELAAAVDVVIDDSGRIIRRDGTTATTRTEAWKNLFGCGSYGLGTTGNALAVIEPDMSKTNIRNITEGARMSFVRASDGIQDVIFYCNGHEKGRVIKKISYTWPLLDYVGPATRKELFEAPIGHILEIRNRMFIGQDNILWYSMPISYYHYELSNSYFEFPSRLRMVQAVDEGLWVSDSESIYFLGGEIAPSMQEMPRQIKKADYPAREGSAVKVPASQIGIEGLTGIVVIFTTDEGICIGAGNGRLINITEKKLTLPSGLTGAGFYKDGHYTCTID